MSGKHLVAVMLLAAICLGALVFYGWRGGQEAQPGENTQPEENIQSEAENVADLTYLGEHIEEFENENVKTSGNVENLGDTFIMWGDFSLSANGASIIVKLQENVNDNPPENSAIILTGEVRYSTLETGFYYIYVDNWITYQIISLADVENNPENYLDEIQTMFTIVRIEPTTIGDWYGNTENGYNVTIKDDYNYETSFYISQDNYQNYVFLVGNKTPFKLTGTNSAYFESHISMFPNLLVYEPHDNYLAAWWIHIRLL